jgi:hypothetical protein
MSGLKGYGFTDFLSSGVEIVNRNSGQSRQEQPGEQQRRYRLALFHPAIHRYHQSCYE